MPNGRSGGFLIETSDLKRLISAVSADAPIAMVVDESSGPRPRETDAKEVLRLVGECAYERVAVEEQDHASYIIHLRNVPTPIWVVVLQSRHSFRISNRGTINGRSRTRIGGWIDSDFAPCPLEPSKKYGRPWQRCAECGGCLTSRCSRRAAKVEVEWASSAPLAAERQCVRRTRS
jgi:hypothetical protein